eukprot:359506-Chlamydomonas_euryale.AAC.2
MYARGATHWAFLHRALAAARPYRVGGQSKSTHIRRTSSRDDSRAGWPDGAAQNSCPAATFRPKFPEHLSTRYTGLSSQGVGPASTIMGTGQLIAGASRPSRPCMRRTSLNHLECRSVHCERQFTDVAS